MSKQNATETLLGLRSFVRDLDLVSKFEESYKALYNSLLESPSDAVAYAASPSPGVNNVVGLGIGHHTPSGASADLPHFRVLVRRKISREQLPHDALIPSSINGIPVSVEDVGDIEGFPGFKGRYRPILAGVSGSLAASGSVGTLGCFVTPNAQKVRQKRLMLTNNHVVANLNEAEKGSLVVQPGSPDGGREASDVVGYLYDFVPLLFSGSDNLVDAAVISLSSFPDVKRLRRMLRNDRGRGYNKSEKISNTNRNPTPGMVVQKSGRTTGHTVGTIDLTDVTITVGYGDKKARFKDQFRVYNPDEAFSQPGDSGSLVTMVPNNEPVGLLFSGSSVRGRHYTFCNDIRNVLKALDIRIDH